MVGRYVSYVGAHMVCIYVVYVGIQVVCIYIPYDWIRVIDMYASNVGITVHYRVCIRRMLI